MPRGRPKGSKNKPKIKTQVRKGTNAKPTQVHNDTSKPSKVRRIPQEELDWFDEYMRSLITYYPPDEEDDNKED